MKYIIYTDFKCWCIIVFNDYPFTGPVKQNEVDTRTEASDSFTKRSKTYDKFVDIALAEQ